MKHTLMFLTGLLLATLAVKAADSVALADDVYLDLAQATRATCGWGTARNGASVAGQPLRVGSAEFESGVGTHAPAELVYRLDGNTVGSRFTREAFASHPDRVLVTRITGQRLFQRVSLQLGDAAGPSLPTNERLAPSCQSAHNSGKHRY